MDERRPMFRTPQRPPLAMETGRYATDFSLGSSMVGSVISTIPNERGFDEYSDVGSTIHSSISTSRRPRKQNLSKKKDLTPEQQITFVDTVSRFPCLYDQRDAEYKNTAYTSYAWNTVVSRLQLETGVILSGDAASEEWQRLRAAYRADCNRRTKSGQAAVQKPPNPLYGAMSFLRECQTTDMTEDSANVDENFMDPDDGASRVGSKRKKPMQDEPVPWDLLVSAMNAPVKFENPAAASRSRLYGEMFAKELDTLPEAEQWQFFKRVMDDLHDRAMQLKGSKQAGQSSSAAIDQSNDDSPFL